MHRRVSLPLDDLDTLVDLVDAHGVAAVAQLPGDKIGEFRLASRPVAIAQHEIGAVPTSLAVFAAALGRHRMAVYVPDDPELAVGTLTGFVEYTGGGRMVAVEPGEDRARAGLSGL